MKKYKRVYIEITNICNLNCSFCAKTKRSPAILSREQFGHILEQLSPYTKYLNFHVMGEPTLHPELGEFLKLAEQNCFQVNLTTNGTLLTGTLADMLLNSPALRKISVSLHSFEANPSSAKLQDYLSEVIAFAKRASKTESPFTALRLWNLDGAQTKGENELNDFILNTLKEAFSIDFSTESLKEHHDITLAPRVFLQAAEKFQWPDMALPPQNHAVFCHGLRDQFAVLSDGTVVPCCLDHEGDIPLGNLFERPLAEILNSSRAKAIYDGFSARKAVEPLCQRCGYAQKF